MVIQFRSDQSTTTMAVMDLPPELLKLIADHVEDKQTLRLVCKSWNVSLVNDDDDDDDGKITICGTPLLHPKLPKLLPQLPVNSRLSKYIVSTAVYILRRRIDGPYWVVGVQQLNPGKFHLVHPLTYYLKPRADEFSLPKIRSFVPTRISTGFTITKDLYHLHVLNRRITKIIYWRNPNKSASNDFILMLTGWGDLILMSSDCYNPRELSYGRLRRFTDITQGKNRVWALDCFGRVYGIDPEMGKITTVLAAHTDLKKKKMKLGYEWRNQLFEFDDRLYMVNPEPQKIEVLKLNHVYHVWEKINNLGDKMLFITDDSCFFVKGSDLGPFSGNLIVFHNDRYPFVNEHEEIRLFKAPYSRLIIYDYAMSSIISIPALVAVFWPPPPWIFEEDDPHHPLSIRGRVEADKSEEVEKVTRCDWPTSKKPRTT